MSRNRMDNYSKSTTVAEEAANWIDLLAEPHCGEATRQSFVDCLMRSPVHVEEYIRISALQEEASQAMRQDAEWLNELLEDVDQNIVDLPAIDRQDTLLKQNAPVKKGILTRPASRRRWLYALAASIALMAVLTVGVVGLKPAFLYPVQQEQIITSLGEQRSMLLDDGTLVQINTSSNLSIHIDTHIRHIDLYEGEAIFYVAKDPDRPFLVYSGNTRVEAIGTSFNVYRKNKSVLVTVVEGRVAVNSGKDSPKSLLVDNGQQVSVASTGVVGEIQQANIERATAWTERRLVFENDTIETVVREFNRYNKAPLVLPKGVSERRRISGVFNANNPEAFLALLATLEE